MKFEDLELDYMDGILSHQECQLLFDAIKNKKQAEQVFDLIFKHRITESCINQAVEGWCAISIDQDRRLNFSETKEGLKQSGADFAASRRDFMKQYGVDE